jgi:hypothetical protein
MSKDFSNLERPRDPNIHALAVGFRAEYTCQ